MSRTDVNLLVIAARVAHAECKGPAPVSQKVLSKAEKLKLREVLMRKLALNISELEQEIVKTIGKIATLHKLEDKMPPCQWRQLMEQLIATLNHQKRGFAELEHMLRRFVLEPDNDELLKIPV